MNMSSTTQACFQQQSTRIVSRGFSVALGSVILSLALTACIGPVKPVPTQQSQEAPPPPTETADTPKQVEPAPADAPPSPSATLPVPLPPIGVNRPAGPQETGEVPFVEAKPVLVTASRESCTAKNATSGTKTDTPHPNRETTSTT
jgi:hypothetical protein